jgi:tetratricopeptide (TPR) repeat protein
LAKLRGVLCALLLLLVPGAGRAQAPPTSPELEEGLRLLRDMEDARALEAFGRALERAGADERLKARIYLNMGIAHGNLLKRQAATEAFVKALRADPSITLPPRTSPKIEALFRRARQEVQQPAPPTGEETKPPTAAPAPPPPRRPSFLRRHLPAIAVMGVAGGTLVTGIVLGALSRSAADRAADIKLTYDEATGYHDKATRRALGANITFGIAGAAAVASGVLFYLSYRSERRAAAALVPGPDGAALLLEGRF